MRGARGVLAGGVLAVVLLPGCTSGGEPPRGPPHDGEGEEVAEEEAPDPEGAQADPEPALEEEEVEMAELTVTSEAFGDGQPIPERFTCDGDDSSPPLAWERGPDGTVGYALVMDDPDAPGGTFVHWVAWNISDTSLPERVPAVPRGGDGVCQGRNSWRRTGYGGPCPPSGRHRYLFKVFALDAELDLPPDTTKQQLVAAMEGHVLARGELLGTYARER